MQVRILFFGILKDIAGRGSDSLVLPEGATLADLVAHYTERVPQLRDLAPSIAMSINQEYAAPESKLKSGDEIALLPPVSGGSEAASETHAPAGRRRYASIVHEKIDTQQVLDKIKRPEDGAVAVFDGIVRNNSRGRPTLYLDYEAYEEMALKQMEALAVEALAQFQVRDVAIVHRLGRLRIGETSVLIAVASAHRAAAFEACRWLIDTLKHTVPIWKKEYFEGGAVWAAGEPFPSDIAGPRSGTPATGPASK